MSAAISVCWSGSIPEVAARAKKRAKPLAGVAPTFPSGSPVATTAFWLADRDAGRHGSDADAARIVFALERLLIVGAAADVRKLAAIATEFERRVLEPWTVGRRRPRNPEQAAAASMLAFLEHRKVRRLPDIDRVRALVRGADHHFTPIGLKSPLGDPRGRDRESLVNLAAARVAKQCRDIDDPKAIIRTLFRLCGLAQERTKHLFDAQRKATKRAR